MSDPSGLADRLRRFQAARQSPPEQSVEEPRERADRSREQGDRELPAGWQRLAPHLWMRETVVQSPLELDRPLPLLTASVDDDERLVFLDTETTGLSGGAGTLAFLVGVGRLEEGRLHVRQYFASDYPGEADLIGAIARELRPVDFVVSYNGKSFDLPLLRTRFTLNGRRLAIAGQIDLLHTARRLWSSSIGSCTLHAVEEHVLATEREEDIPGYLVPEIYFQYLRDGDPEPLRPVFSHHRYDIVSLATLLNHIETLPSSGEGVDREELGRLMIDRGLPAGLELLQRRAREGSLRAMQLASLHLKRLGRWEEAVELWSSAWERAPGYFAGVELAKFYEHRGREYARALEIVEVLARLPLRGTPWARNARGEILRRRERLLSKIERFTGTTGPVTTGPETTA